MSNNNDIKDKNIEEQEVKDENLTVEEQSEAEQKVDESAENDNEEEKSENMQEEPSETEKLAQELQAMTDKYLRLSAEFDNYRKRTLKEKMDLMKSAGEKIFTNILPVIDNFERALKSMDESNDVQALKEGVDLIYNNFVSFLKQNGVKPLDAQGKEFDVDLHEALTKIPVTDEKQKGMVVDVIEKGYMLNDKVIRFSKVVVGD